MADPLATPADLAAWVGQTIAEDNPRALAVLSAASLLVRSYAGQEWADPEDEETPEAAKQVTVQVAARVWVNPNNALQETTGPFSTRFGDTEVAGLFLTAAEKDMLSPYRAKVGGLWTLGTTRDELALDEYIDVIGQPGEPMPFLPSDGRLLS